MSHAIVNKIRDKVVNAVAFAIYFVCEAFCFFGMIFLACAILPVVACRWAYKKQEKEVVTPTPEPPKKQTFAPGRYDRCPRCGSFDCGCDPRCPRCGSYPCVCDI